MSVVWVKCEGYSVKFDCDKELIEEKGITPEELERLGQAVVDGFYAEMADLYSITLKEQAEAEASIKDLLEKYNLRYLGTSIAG